MTSKETLRERLKAFRAAMSDDDARSRSLKVKNNLFSLGEFKSARTVAFYVAKRESREVETIDMIRESLSMGKRILVPYVEFSTKRLRFSEITDPDAQLFPGAFGIPEPRHQYRRPVQLNEMDLVIVPGIAFDRNGRRIGHGLGYYDRALREILSINRKAKFIGIAYDFQIADEIPSTPHDVPVHIVVTETRTFRAPAV
ncbi:MAG: 5-formyltetrahydrofolate cyclo-ligase [Candidatus Hadarchaeales archaeon]